MKQWELINAWWFHASNLPSDDYFEWNRIEAFLESFSNTITIKSSTRPVHFKELVRLAIIAIDKDGPRSVPTQVAARMHQWSRDKARPLAEQKLVNRSKLRFFP